MTPAEFAAARRTVDTPFGQIAYAQPGDPSAPAALFVHGVFLNGYLWHDAIAALAPVRRCIAIDLMGHGATRVPDDQDLSFKSQAAMLAAFVDALGLDQVDLVGNDSGGGIAQIFAANNPRRIRTLTLTNCDTHDNVFPPAFLPLVEIGKAGKLSAVFAPMLADADVARKGFAGTFENPDAISDDTLAAFLKPFAEHDATSNVGQRWMTALTPDDLLEIEPKLHEITAPTLVLWGTADTFFEVKWAYWLKDMIPNTTVVEIPGAKLFWPLERPETLAAHVRDLWTANTPAAAPR